MPVVSVTRLHLRSIRFFPLFLWHAVRASRQAGGAAGFLGGWTGREPGLGFWTATAWESLDAMRAFRNAPPHLSSMKAFLRWCDEGGYVHWEQDSPQVIDAAIAYARMAEAGKLSKVLYPSARHRAGATIGIRAPRVDNVLTPPRRVTG